MKTTYNKIFFLTILSSVFFLLLFLSLFYYSSVQEKQVFDKTSVKFTEDANTILELNSSSYIAYLNDATFWDDFVSFMTTKDLDWYESEISKGVKLYKADCLTVYDLKGKCIANTNTTHFKRTFEIPIEALQLLYKNHNIRYYQKTPQGIVEIFGATIHPSNDPFKNLSKPSGYFFIIRLLDADFFTKLEKTTHSKISFLDKKNIKSSCNKITANIKLKSWDDSTIEELIFQRNFTISFAITNNILIIIIIAFILNVSVCLFCSKKWIFSPLLLITSVLETGSKHSIVKLKQLNSEFSYIGELFEKSKKQKNELIKSKIKAEESDLLKSTFLANLSHEIRTPMNAILGFTDLIINTNPDKKEQLEYLNIIDKSGKNLISIIDDLIEMSKIDANQIVPNFNSINLGKLLNELYQSFLITISLSQKRDLKLIKTNSFSDYNIVSDETKLKQILVNLITNSIKYTNEGNVTFGFTINEDLGLIEFVVKDTGVGISKKNQLFIFDRFKRIESDISIKEGGLGLGLAITKAYVDILGGTISLSSIEGKGTEFVFAIPLKYDAISDIEVVEVQEVKGVLLDEILVLIAEDDNINFLLFKQIMKNSGFVIIRAENGQIAVDECVKNPNINLVLMDIKMPIMNGFEAFEKIKSLRPNLPIIAQTAYSSAEDIERFQKAGFDDYITKPLNRDKLLEIIYKHIHKNE